MDIDRRTAQRTARLRTVHRTVPPSHLRRSDVVVAPRCVRGARYWCRSPFYGKNYALPQCESYLTEALLQQGLVCGAA